MGAFRGDRAESTSGAGGRTRTYDVTAGRAAPRVEAAVRRDVVEVSEVTRRAVPRAVPWADGRVSPRGGPPRRGGGSPPTGVAPGARPHPRGEPSSGTRA
ncbi:hypothetical protein [Streptomyces griseocarneus]|uniref:hypothetical protein n=1 Tax=Streptomyces griseocarneus TaxID=51201 RepID=UPI003D6D5CE4